MFDLMLAPFAACLILVGIHAYLGIHVLERGIIFVDLALAQLAALGSITAVLAGFPLHTPQSYVFSLLFTLAGAVLFSLTRGKRNGVSQEAVIGIAYVVCAAASVLALERIPGESQHIKEMLVGNILFVSWRQIMETLFLYGLVGVFHWVFRKKIMLISSRPADAEKNGVSIRWWDFLFYAAFGLVVTSSVEIAGVLLVFSFLVIPAFCAMLLVRGFTPRLAAGWTMGVFTSLAGIYASARFDLPTGAAIVCAFGVLAFACIVIASLKPGLCNR